MCSLQIVSYIQSVIIKSYPVLNMALVGLNRSWPFKRSLCGLKGFDDK